MIFWYQEIEFLIPKMISRYQKSNNGYLMWRNRIFDIKNISWYSYHKIEFLISENLIFDKKKLNSWISKIDFFHIKIWNRKRRIRILGPFRRARKTRVFTSLRRTCPRFPIDISIGYALEKELCCGARGHGSISHLATFISEICISCF